MQTKAQDKSVTYYGKDLEINPGDYAYHVIGNEGGLIIAKNEKLSDVGTTDVYSVLVNGEIENWSIYAMILVHKAKHDVAF